MKQNARNYTLLQRLGALCLAVLMAVTMLPTGAVAAESTEGIFGTVTKVADPDTIRRHDEVYGDNTENAGKVTVGKSVSEDPVTISYGNTSKTFTPTGDNFIVTASQTAQVMALASESAAPVDVVFVLDTSSSMSDEVGTMVTAANNAIRTLLQANPNNRVGVVAFSGVEGRGTSGGAAANVLTPLGRYDGDGETAHLTLTNGYIYGRGYQNGTRLNRDGTSSGTNIQAGVVVGARELMNATNITVDGVTRIPFLVVMSDGEPSYAVNDTKWYDPSSLTGQIGRQFPAAGLGFLPALTAAYYKAKITEKYFGTNANADNRCFVYTLGLGLETISNSHLALMTVDPANQTTANSSYSTFEGYWNSYEGGRNFNVATGYGGNYTITSNSITATEDYISTYKYNDKYFSARQASDLNSAFDDIVTTIQKQAISSPTKVDPTRGESFSGYLTYTDPIGEYMEVKKVHGLLADGNYYQGKQFAQYISNWDGAPDDFKEDMIKALRERSKTTSATMTDAQIEAFLKAAAASPYQANYVSDTEFDNSIVWYGNAYTAPGDEDTHVQWMKFADNDSVEYIEQQKAAGQIPDGADYVCRSYFYSGTAGGTAANPNNEYMHFVVRVQRSLTAPYQETVVISTPASLLSVEEVFITEEADGGHTAVVTPAEPSRVIYEVGLRSDINAFNIDEIVGKDTAVVYTDAQDPTKNQTYTQETNHSGALANYDAATGTYTFYTNDWNRKRDGSEHHRAQTHVTFDAAADNSFYTYTEDTPIYVKNGNAYELYTGTSQPVGSGYYYARTVYDWSADTTPTNGAYDADQRTVYVPIILPQTDKVVKSGSNWIIKAGVYKASSLSTVADVPKSDNKTDTALIISHPHRTEGEDNSHYTVLLGNNGKLTLKAEKTKTVDVTKPDREAYDGSEQQGTTIQDADGKVVMVGDQLKYTIRVLNAESTATTATVTDVVPTGTKFISADKDGKHTNGVITWSNISVPAAKSDGTMGENTVSFVVEVTEDALSGIDDVVAIDNTATVTLKNSYSYTTNTTKNPPEGKKVVDTNGNAITDPVVVPDVLVYRIRWQNDAVDEKGNPTAAKTITITDKIPTGTTYTANSADHNGVYDEKTGIITWTFANVPAGGSGVVSFRVNVNAAALKDSEGSRYVENDAIITVDNNYRITNEPVVQMKTGNLALTKVVSNIADFPGVDWTAKTFNLNLYEIGDDLNGEYVMKRALKDGTALADSIVNFAAGKASVQIKHNEVYTIEDLPAGIIILVTEQETGYTATYKVNNSNTTSTTEGRVTIPAETTASVEVTNTYDPADITIRLKGTKILDTNTTVGNKTFGFTALSCDAQGVVGQNPNELTGEATVSSADKDATITFSPVTFSKAGNYYYLIEEINGGVVGIDYADTQYLLTIAVYDDGSGTLTYDASFATREGDTGTFEKPAGSSGKYPDDAIVFTNTYEPLETQLTLEATKILDGRKLEAGRYSFEVLDSNDKVVTTGTNDANGKVTFRPITYTAPTANPITYKIREVNGGIHGVEYSDAEHEVTVTVVDNNGKLVATPTYPQEGAKFTNTFTPDGIKVVLEAIKVLDNQSGDATRKLKDKEFNFVVKDKTTDAVVATGMNDANGKVTFSPIGYTKADLDGATEKTFEYVVSEVVPDLGADPYMDYDESSFDVSVKVTYDATDGELEYDITYPTGGVEFNNIQHPSSIDVFPVASKTTLDTNDTTSNVPDDATFSFVVINAKDGSEAGVGVGAANGAVTFSSLTFNQAGTYKYFIKEAHTGTHHGITYDDAIYLMTIVVTNTNGELGNTVTYTGLKSGGDPAKAEDYTETVVTPTFNNKYEAKGQIAITAKKDLQNLTLKDGDFAFRLVRQGVANPGEIAGVTDQNGKITFANLYYDLGEFTDGQITKTIHYKMSEVEPAVAKIPGVTYDKTVHDVYVTITHDTTTGTINARVTDAQGNPLTDTSGADLDPKDSNVTFTNTYAPVEGTKATITAKKELTGRTLKAGEFSFNLYHVTTDDQGNESERLVDTMTNDKDGNITFTRNYPAGVLNGADVINTKYVIREVNNNLGGVEYDTKEYPVFVKIVDNKNGTISCQVSYSETEVVTTSNITFKNTYDAKDTTYTPVASKILNNRDLQKDEFSFVVEKKGTQNTWQVVSTGTNNADKDNDGIYDDVTFSPIGFEEAGTYYFRVSEVEGKLTGVKYDKTPYYLKVVVVDNNDGTMTATGTYHKVEDCTDAAVDAVFTNTYTPQDVSVQFKANKILTGRDMEQGEFSFIVKDVNNKTVATGGNVAAAAGQTAAVVFSDIGFKLSDLDGATEKSFTYTISELKTAQGGVYFSDAKYKATVTLKNNAATGILETKVVYSTGGMNVATPNFHNSYRAAPVTIDIPVDKTLVNKKLENEEFVFTLSGEGVNKTAKNDANGSAAFELEFTAAGTYEYTVSEAVASPAKAPGVYTMDNAVKVTVSVTDDKLGKLHATVSYANADNGEAMGGVEFINSYTAPALTTDLDVEIDAVKNVESPVKELPEDVKAGYKFQVLDITNKEISTGVSDKTGAINFSAFTFEKAGEYHYWIIEPDSDPANNKPGVQLDATAWEVHILVRYNDGTAVDDAGVPVEVKDFEDKTVPAGKLYIGKNDVKIYKLDRAAAETEGKVGFTNVYDPAGITLHLTAKKVLNGRELKDREFGFYLMDGGLIAAEGFNDAQGNIRFTVNYDAADIGIHNYKVVEQQGSVPGVIYDTKEYASVSVEVKDDQTKGQLVASVGTTVLADGDTIGTGVTITNDYIAEGNVAVVKANKVLSGKPMKAEEFTFQLVNAADEKDVHKATNTADGAVIFQIPVEKAGVTTYKLSEVKGTDANMTYDAKAYEVTVTATDDGLGNLVIKVAYDTDDGYAPTFRNTYTPSAVPVQLVGEKVLKGRDMTAGEFKFEVRDSSGALVALGTNDAKGVLTFNEIKFAAVGTYTLTITEVKGTAGNVTYDTTKFQVTVEVTNADGELVAEVTYPTDGVKFVNTYENKEVPDTGDHSNVSMFVILAVVSLGACVVLVVLLKKKKQA